ncbi:helix-turn-helix domain-containing protein [Microbacterium sp. zg.Y1090]|uniref:helix-turn-helix domain-containing protein n=1 Tax=Microbacterium TaxID=33882 RepID=UPI00214C4048|nr:MULTISPECIES: helix-turn-helix domain-containing protein [unclassified Microbacterium]MCR2811596.1 helix-turn-helix domain-containing protein [Microbacterium sp. zg.Y1084]MCR2818982.1 helix-turn-helix domain-containing protein [Microbacterium sp. zg.Y1090]MDL5487632.1 helix-turn-helix domain-containing protein [Microbacterium sp. zg-Y1211]WIM27287.1 helix-turn-helix domain-containing protein [Microbacterium sp. zg-Y1090]
MDDDPADLRDTVTELMARVTALEARLSRRDEPTSPPPDPDSADAFWALRGVEAERAENPSLADGIVMIVGSLTLPTGAPVAWQQGVATEGLLEADWSEHAAALQALAHPVRLELLRRILTGTTTTAELAGIDSLGTTGQLHHHLRQLVSSGWVRQSGRGSYEVPAARVVPLLSSLLGTGR